MSRPTLHRSLTAAQLSMIAIGGAIGTGLFLGSGFAIQLAGPAVLLSYLLAGLVALALMGCLAEMTVAAPVAGSFGGLAAVYLGPFAGFVIRWCYWSAVVLAVGTEVTAVALYMGWWFAAVPGIVWIAGFSAALVAVNLAPVGWFGRVEYGFSAIKVAAILAFLLLGTAFLVRGGTGLAHLHDVGGFAPHGAWGVWQGVIVAVFSYLSVEMIAVAAGEAVDPERAVVRAFRATIARLLLFYLGSLLLMLAILPWTAAGTATSPFVTVTAATGVPYAAGVINAVVLVAALSAMNSQLYTASRMLWSLAEAGQAPAALGALSPAGVPRRAVWVSSAGIAVATAVFVLAPGGALPLMIGVSMFGALVTWALIFATHAAFRRRHGPPAAFRMWGGGQAGVAGALAVIAVLVTTAWTDAFRWTLAYGLPLVALLALAWAASPRLRAAS